MVIETIKTFKHGFTLTEANLRRIIETVSEQLRERLDDLPPKLVFAVGLRNGVTVSTYTLERVLTEENLGASQIVRLEIDWYAPRVLDPTVVSLAFINADFESERGDTSIRLFVRGESQEWVDTTATLVEDRVRAIRRFTPNQLEKRSVSRLASLLISPLILLSILLGIIHPLTANVDKILWYTYTMYEIWNFEGTPGKISGTISRDSLEAANENGVNEVISTLVSQEPFWIAVSAVLMLDLVLLFFLRYYPFYNFCWGSYLKTFPRRGHGRAFVFTVTVCTIVASFVYSIATNLTGRHA